ncbi:FAD-dependent monooxygenase [Spelaeicoccus albus]|uniref:2-polyprenyl-6-methoxyphenol hydroxylase-like FAD-dependent oxidoreductase n=1 Tax=Spelaeicoccus albus TaxID=1280376 RepID=A0A7Z0A9K6_9MICO|nr:FAD-dependent monooxygenase [Spelaeicoccus albus]NYI66922.1 2-polyprenyl-6-methoxyphenol hydroxylase-like FAD-dependent oxidoreductase [Spelaeicoccus albus]
MAHALIVGAGIAGDTLAVLLERSGWRVTVVEIAPALRSGGQTVDLRGDSREVLERMGLLDDALAALVPQRGMAWITARGRRLASMPVEALGGRGFVSREELLRTDLARILHDATGEHVEHRFGDTVEALTESPDGVTVRFRSGKDETFDLVVGADGAHSKVRALHFGDEEQYRKPLGLAHAWFTLREQPATPPLGGWALVHNAAGRRAVASRPGHSGEQEIGLTFEADSIPRGDREAQFALLDREFDGVGWRAAEFLAAARTAPDFALDTYEQIHMPTWSSGRVVLVGDSAWCTSPLSGLGTALGLHGAEQLAAALDRTGAKDDTAAISVAFKEFEAAMRPRAESAGQLIPGRVDMVAPKSRLAIIGNALLMRLIQLRIMRGVVAKATAGSGHSVD